MWVKGADSVKNTMGAFTFRFEMECKDHHIVHFGHLMISWSASVAVAQNTGLPAPNPQEAWVPMWVKRAQSL